MSSNQVVLITGAARGFGRATAVRFAENGARIAVHVRDAGRAGALADELGPNAQAVSGDLTAAGAPQEIVARTIAHFGRLDVLVNNAAAAWTTRFEKIGEDEWRRAVETNLTAPFLLIQAAVPAMKAQRFGRIINISSTAGRSVSTLGGAHYTASKAGLQGLTRAAAKELGPHGITVNAICPGMFDTELSRESASSEKLEALARSFPVPRLGQPRELADLIVYLASETAGYITGACIDINGGDLMLG